MTKRNLAFMLATTALVHARAFDNNAWKTDADGKLEADANGNPIWIDANGGERTVEGGTISRLNGEAADQRKRAEKAEGALKAFEGLDAEKARAALDTVSKLDQKQLIDAGEVDKVRDSVKAEYVGQLSERDQKIAERDTRIENMQIDRVFDDEWIGENVAIPRDMFGAYFRKNFKVEGDKIVAFDATGNRLMSPKRVGEDANPREALELLVDRHSQKDLILKPAGGGGSGSNGDGGKRGTGRAMTRADFDKLEPASKAEAAAKARTGELTITD